MKTKTWKLPKPQKEDGEWEWEPIVRIGRFVPFGYRQDPDDCDILQPIPEELELFERAKRFLKQYSYREVAAWLSTQSERYISHVGLYKRVKIEQQRKNEASTQRYLAQRYKEALQKAQKLETQRLGYREKVSSSTA